MMLDNLARNCNDRLPGIRLESTCQAPGQILCQIGTEPTLQSGASTYNKVMGVVVKSRQVLVVERI